MVLSLNLLEEVPEARALLMHGGAGYMANHGASFFAIQLWRGGKPRKPRFFV